jgi:hypothetical protein
MSEYVVLRVFDKLRVKVDTTVEFPLDIVCTLVITPEDEAEYELIKKNHEEIAAKKMADKNGVVKIAVEEESETLENEI